jgi:hypothetical protein
MNSWSEGARGQGLPELTVNESTVHRQVATVISFADCADWERFVRIEIVRIERDWCGWLREFERSIVRIERDCTDWDCEDWDCEDWERLMLIERWIVRIERDWEIDCADWERLCGLRLCGLREIQFTWKIQAELRIKVLLWLCRKYAYSTLPVYMSKFVINYNNWNIPKNDMNKPRVKIYLNILPLQTKRIYSINIHWDVAGLSSHAGANYDKQWRIACRVYKVGGGGTGLAAKARTI